MHIKLKCISVIYYTEKHPSKNHCKYSKTHQKLRCGKIIIASPHIPRSNDFSLCHVLYKIWVFMIFPTLCWYFRQLSIWHAWLDALRPICATMRYYDRIYSKTDAMLYKTRYFPRYVLSSIILIFGMDKMTVLKYLCIVCQFFNDKLIMKLDCYLWCLMLDIDYVLRGNLFNI